MSAFRRSIESAIGIDAHKFFIFFILGFFLACGQAFFEIGALAQVLNVSKENISIIFISKIFLEGGVLAFFTFVLYTFIQNRLNLAHFFSGVFCISIASP